MIIGKNFPGLISGYLYNGDIITSGDIEINIYLHVTGSIQSGGSINSKNSIVAKNYISSGGSINALNSISTFGYIHSNGNINAGGYISSGMWINANGSISAKNGIAFSQDITAKSIEMCGIKTKSLAILDGLQYRVWAFDNHIKIGCQTKTKDEWLKVTEEDAIEMGGGKMWEHRDEILNLCKGEEAL